MLPFLAPATTTFQRTLDRIERLCIDAKASDAAFEDVIAFEDVTSRILDEYRNCKRLIVQQAQSEKTYAIVHAASEQLRARSDGLMRFGRLMTILRLRPAVADEHQQRRREIFLALCRARQEDDVRQWREESLQLTIRIQQSSVEALQLFDDLQKSSRRLRPLAVEFEQANAEYKSRKAEGDAVRAAEGEARDEEQQEQGHG